MRDQEKERVDTLIASDWHLGWKRCEAKTIIVMLSHFKYERLILNGDIFHGLDLSGMRRSHFDILKCISDATKSGCEVIWVSGNRDNKIAYLSAAFAGAQIREEYLWRYRGKKYLAIHGDQFEKHRPRAFPEATRDYEIADGALAYAKRRNVNYIICGHWHVLEDRSNKGRFYYNAGCGTHLPVTCITVGKKGIRAHRFFDKRAVKIREKQLSTIEKSK
jgi:UDP-2,3-diacylglucosamine pyrophosphatase LpxH